MSLQQPRADIELLQLVLQLRGVRLQPRLLAAEPLGNDGMLCAKLLVNDGLIRTQLLGNDGFIRTQLLGNDGMLCTKLLGNDGLLCTKLLGNEGVLGTHLLGNDGLLGTELVGNDGIIGMQLLGRDGMICTQLVGNGGVLRAQLLDEQCVVGPRALCNECLFRQQALGDHRLLVTQRLRDEQAASASVPTTRSSPPTRSISGCSGRCRPRERASASLGSERCLPKRRWRRSWPRSARKRAWSRSLTSRGRPGNVLPVEELREETALPMLVDGAQSAGAVAVDASPYDFYTVSGQKWLCGPDSTGALYVREPEQLDVALPSYFSQIAHDEAGAYTPKAGAARFDSGWIPTASLAGIEAALGTVPHWAYHHSVEIAARCWALVAERAQVVTAPGQATLISFAADGDAAEEAARLRDVGVIVRDMPGTGWLRVSCGWWTSDADLERLITSL